MSQQSWFGIGLRPHHYADWSRFDSSLWVEVMSDNYIHQAGGRGLFHLNQALAGRRAVMHGVGLNIAGTEKLEQHYLDGLVALADRINPYVISDHLCFTRASGRSTYDLLPFPYTQENLQWVAQRVNEAQRALGRRLSLENLSRYVAFKNDEMTEFEFMSRLCYLTGCGILLDVNNVIVSATNLGNNVEEELRPLEPWMITQYHVAGHTKHDHWLHDTHDKPVNSDCWTLLGQCLQEFGESPIILENDEPATTFAALLEEINLGTSFFSVQAAPRLASADLIPQPQNCPVPPSLEEFQHHFVNVVQTPPWETICNRRESIASTCVKEEHTQQLDVYRHCFYSRITRTLSETLLIPLVEEFGTDRVQAWLANYAIEAGFKATLLQDNLDDFAAYLGAHEREEKYPNLRERLSLCVARWRVLTGADHPLERVGPHSSIDTIFLNPTSQFADTNQVTSEGHSMNNTANNPPSNLTHIVFRSSPTEIQTVSIPQECRGVANSLKRGLSLNDALQMEGAHHTDTAAPVVQNWLTSLFKLGALVTQMVALIAFQLHMTPSAQAEVWKLQTERLLQVSGSLLDDVPTGVSIDEHSIAIDVGGAVTIIPDIDPTVGSKQEGIPNAPIHFVPKAALSVGSKDILAGNTLLSLRGWLGFLPSQASRLVVGQGVDFQQRTAGIELSVVEKNPRFAQNLRLGVKSYFQTNEAELSGHFSTSAAIGPKDSFQVSNTQAGLALFLHHKTTGLFSEVLGLVRSSEIHFFISEDNNSIKLQDGYNPATNELADGAAGGQVSLGWSLYDGVQLGMAQLYLPQRIAAPRFFFRLQLPMI